MPSTRPSHALRTRCAPAPLPLAPRRSWFLVLPAAVGFAAVLLGLLYSACLIETVDDEAPLRLLTTLPAYHSIPAYPIR